MDELKINQLFDNIGQQEDTSEFLKVEKQGLEDKQDYALKQKELELKQEEIDGIKQNREERKKYAIHIFRFTITYTVLIFILLFLSGFKFFGFFFSDTVIVTILTTTTVNFLGFFLLVTSYLFNTKQNHKEP